jgi:transcriptional regulator with XRE-family HTH domain
MIPMAGQGRKPKIPIEMRKPWAQRIIAARNAMPDSPGQELAAERLKVPQSKLGDWETGKTQPNIAEFEALGSFFKLPPEFLAFGVIGQPSQQDDLIGPLIDRHAKDETFVLAFGRVVAMFAEEGFNLDLHAGLKVAARILKDAKAAPDHAGIRERIEVAVAGERQILRDAITEALKKRDQP